MSQSEIMENVTNKQIHFSNNIIDFFKSYRICR